jgi:hypothetical protein
MIKLMDYRPSDHVGIVMGDDFWALAIPPYGELRKISLVRAKEYNEIHAGFLQMNLTFGDWDSLRWFLQKAQKAQGYPTYSIGSLGPQFLPLATYRDIETYLNQIENELIPKRYWQDSAEILLAIMHLPKISVSSFKRILGLLEKIIPHLPMAIES